LTDLIALMKYNVYLINLISTSMKSFRCIAVVLIGLICFGNSYSQNLKYKRDSSKIHFREEGSAISNSSPFDILKSHLEKNSSDLENLLKKNEVLEKKFDGLRVDSQELRERVASIDGQLKIVIGLLVTIIGLLVTILIKSSKLSILETKLENQSKALEKIDHTSNNLKELIGKIATSIALIEQKSVQIETTVNNLQGSKGRGFGFNKQSDELT
jgi:chromosome segregation ATPase